MNCIQCGAELNSEEQYCHVCGIKIDNNQLNTIDTVVPDEPIIPEAQLVEPTPVNKSIVINHPLVEKIVEEDINKPKKEKLTGLVVLTVVLGIGALIVMSLVALSFIK